MARPKKAAEVESEKTVKAVKPTKNTIYKFQTDHRLVINNAVNKYAKGDVITAELFRANYPAKSGELFLQGLLDAGILK